MNNLNYQVYTLNENLEDHEFIIQLNDSQDINTLNEQEDFNKNLNPFYTQTQQYAISNDIVLHWKLSKKLNNLHKTFQQTILNQCPCLPCSICGYLLYPEKTKWIPYKENVLYPFKAAFPRAKLAFHPRSPSRIAVCSSCKSKPKRIYPPYLFPIPPEIQIIPLAKRKYLSPIYLHSSLSRTPGI